MSGDWVEAFPYFEVAIDRADAEDPSEDADWRWIDKEDYVFDPKRPPRALSGFEVSDERAVEALASLTELEHLDLSYAWEVPPERLEVLTQLAGLRWLSLEGVELSAHLPVLPALEHLDLSTTDLSEPAHCAPLAGYSALRVLSLAQSEISPGGLAHVAGLSALEELDLSHVQLDAPSLALLGGLTRLRRLDLSGTGAVGDALPAAFPSSCGLEQLSLSFTDELDLGCLASLTRLQKLDLSNVTGPLDLTPLSALTGLRELLLVEDELRPEPGLAPLAGLLELETLDLERTPIRDEDLAHLLGLTRLRRLRLSGCGASAAALAQLEALPGVGFNPGLPSECSVAVERQPSHELDDLDDLDDSEVDRWTWIPIEEYAAEEGRPIRALDLEMSDVTDAGLRAVEGQDQLELLSLSCCYELTDAGLEHLAGLTGLRFLDLSGNELTATGLGEIADLGALEALNLDGVDLSEGGAEHLAGLTGLRVLDLTASGLRAQDMVHLAGLTELVELDLSHTECGAGLEHLAGCTQLRKLNLSQVPIRGASVEFLRGLTELIELDLDGTGVGQGDLSPLSGLTKLTRLDLSGADVASVEALASLTALDDLDLEGNPRLAQVEALQGLTALSILDLTGTGVSSLSPLASLTRLTSLDAARAPLKPGALEGLGGLPCLDSLVLSHTPLTGTSLTGLAGCATLITLDLEGTQVGDDGIEHLTKVPNLSVLTLRGTPITDAAIPTLGRISELGFLDLRGTWIDREAGQALRDALKGLDLLQLPGDEAEHLASEREVAGRPVRDFPAERLRDPLGTAYRVRASSYDPEFPVAELLDRLLAEPRAEELRGLVIGSWEECYERSSEPIVQALVERAPRLPQLEALFLGDMSGAECELAWILQSDVSPLLEAFPELTWFGVRGGNGLAFSRAVRHPALKTLVIETAGLPAEVGRAVAAAHLPQLEHLELWLGTTENEGGVEVEHLLPILSGKLFPRLRHLALRNSDRADEIAQAVATAPVVGQLETLDLSLGTLGDAGAEALLASPSVQQLRLLDLQHHFMTEAVAAKFADLAVEVRVGEPESAGGDWRYVAIGE